MQIKIHSQISNEPVHFASQLENFKKTVENSEIGFFKLPEESQFIQSTLALAEELQNKKYFVQIGIGGSALGPEMLVSSLAKNTDKSFIVLDNTDSDYLAQQLAKIELDQSVFYVVSKSGGTAETIAGYSIVRNLLKVHGISDAKDYFVFCTDPKNGQLRKHVEGNGYRALDVPSNIGGRFSVLSPVGLLPAAFMGVNISALYQGANSYKAKWLSSEWESNELFQVAELTFNLMQNYGVDQTVCMPYSSLLRHFSAWFIQLWAESLGKKRADGSATGLTPIPAYGATDQHSQMQLFMEGPNNKLLFLINVLNRGNDYSLDSNLEFESGKKLAPFSMNQLLHAEFKGSLQALKENKRNIVEIELERLDENAMGAMILFFESLTAVMGNYLNIDAFNQPGVELGKKYAFEFLDSMRK